MAKTLWAGLLGVSILAAIPLFIRLDALPLFIFDEGRLANNALEMVENGNWIVTHFEGEPDLWNTKPPLMIWLQALSMKLLGADLLAVRLPAALAGFVTILALFLFANRHTGSSLASWTASLILLTTPGYITTHSTRTGDYDALLTLCSTLFLFQFFGGMMEEDAARKRRRLWLAMGFFALGVLTKGIVIFLFLPGLLVYLAASRKPRALLREPHFYYATLAAAGVVALWYLGREWAQPSYLEAVVQNELGGRFLAVTEGHKGPWYFYLQNLWKSEFLPWIGLIPLAVWFAFRDPSAMRRPLWGFLLIQSGFFLLILSLAKTKLNWYAIPVFPLLSLAAGGSLGLLLDQVREWGRPAWLLKGLVILGIFLIPYAQTVRQTYQPKDTYFDWEKHQYAAFMKHLKPWTKYSVVQTGYNAHVSFYVKKYQMEGRDVQVKYPDQLIAGDTILLCDEKRRNAVLKLWGIKGLYSNKNCGLHLVTSK